MLTLSEPIENYAIDVFSIGTVFVVSVWTDMSQQTL